MAESAGNIPDTIEQMAQDLAAQLEEQSIENPVMVGIHTGGVWIAEQLHNKLNIMEPLGNLDISFYRDDFTRIGMNPQVRPSKLPFSIDNQHIILIDDVLHTGRTIRAALNELFDYGRPASIMLAVLVERGGRELPIEANVVGCRMTLGSNEQVKLIGPDPLSLEIQQSP